jgi:DNA repair exonuclease SbcCD ATPase subunit
MRIAKLTLKNWKCFEGEHELDLDAKVYAIVAREENDPERSNWNGKSSLMEAVDFALYDRLAPSVDGKDGWITHGKPVGEVTVTFDTGERIVRSRHRGKSTKVYFYPAGANARTPSHQELAEDAIRGLLGLDADDFKATCYFEQRQMARLVLAKPEARMDIVAGWFRLGKLQEAEQVVSAEMTGVQRDLTQAKGRIEMARQTWTGVVTELEIPAGAPIDGEPGPTWFDTEIAALYAKLTPLNERVTWLKTCLRQADHFAALQRDAARYDQIIIEGKDLAARGAKDGASDVAALKAIFEKAGNHLADLQGQVALQNRQYRTKLTVARGAFDGVCPLVDRSCPSAEWVNSERQAAETQATDAANVMEELNERLKEAALQHRVAADMLRVAEDRNTRIGTLRAEARRLKPSKEQLVGLNTVPSQETLEEEILKATNAIVDLQNQMVKIELRRQDVQKAADSAHEWQEKADALDARLRTLAEAVAILGKGGAQRRIAERGLLYIEAGANALLAQCGIPLDLKVEWSREGKDLARTCAVCGLAFPASAKAKTCSGCSTERGHNIVNKLVLRPSARSGAAEDLAGGAFQLAASAWLRRQREASWSVALIDEPFGSLDASNRRAFAAHLVSMLRSEYGFEQSFVIAHHAAVLDALPGRIEIVRKGDASTVRVVS